MSPLPGRLDSSRSMPSDEAECNYVGRPREEPPARVYGIGILLSRRLRTTWLSKSLAGITMPTEEKELARKLVRFFSRR